MTVFACHLGLPWLGAAGHHQIRSQGHRHGPECNRLVVHHTPSNSNSHDRGRLSECLRHQATPAAAGRALSPQEAHPSPPSPAPERWGHSGCPVSPGSAGAIGGRIPTEHDSGTSPQIATEHHRTPCSQPMASASEHARCMEVFTRPTCIASPMERFCRSVTMSCLGLHSALVGVFCSSSCTGARTSWAFALMSDVDI